MVIGKVSYKPLAQPMGSKIDFGVELNGMNIEMMNGTILFRAFAQLILLTSSR